MGKYILRRLIIAIPSLLGISLVLFVLLALAPGDPFGELATNSNIPPEVRAALRVKFGIDDPIFVRYLRWLAAMLQGDWGFSFASRIDVELKSVVGSVFFSSDTANPDTYPHFYCDAQMYNTTMPQPDPQIFMNQYLSWEIANKENKWQGRNVSRWQSKEYDAIWKQAEQELDVVKRAAMYIKLNDMVVGDNYILPVVRRPKVQALSANLVPHLTGWDNDLYQIASWYRET